MLKTQISGKGSKKCRINEKNNRTFFRVYVFFTNFATFKCKFEKRKLKINR